MRRFTPNPLTLGCNAARAGILGVAALRGQFAATLHLSFEPETKFALAEMAHYIFIAYVGGLDMKGTRCAAAELAHLSDIKAKFC